MNTKCETKCNCIIKMIKNFSFSNLVIDKNIIIKNNITNIKYMPRIYGGLLIKNIPFISKLLKKKRKYYKNIFKSIKFISTNNHTIYEFACKMESAYKNFKENACGVTATALFESNYFKMGSISGTNNFDKFMEKLKDSEYNIFEITINSTKEFKLGHAMVIIKYGNQYKLYQSYVNKYNLNEYLKMDDNIYNFDEFNTKFISKLKILFQNENYTLDDVKKAYCELTYVDELKNIEKVPSSFNKPVIIWYNNDFESPKSSFSKEMISFHNRYNYISSLKFNPNIYKMKKRTQNLRLINIFEFFHKKIF